MKKSEWKLDQLHAYAYMAACVLFLRFPRHMMRCSNVSQKQTNDCESKVEARWWSSGLGQCLRTLFPTYAHSCGILRPAPARMQHNFCSSCAGTERLFGLTEYEWFEHYCDERSWFLTAFCMQVRQQQTSRTCAFAQPQD
eukprot:3326671-Amphidinium_carterae.1